MCKVVAQMAHRVVALYKEIAVNFVSSKQTRLKRNSKIRKTRKKTLIVRKIR